jgi:O-antigen ligase
MLNKSVERTISNFLFVGVPVTTLFLLTGSVTDPVNATKLFLAGCIGFGAFAIAVVYGAKEIWSTSRVLVITSVLFIVFSLNAVINSSSPLQQNLYGLYGRQTGFITYLILLLIALSATLLRTTKSFTKIIWALLFAGAVNIIYSGWAIIFGDFINWSNPYGNILGFFGNPNFIGAFLGMFIGGSVAFGLSNHFSWRYRIAFVFLGCIALYEIKESHAVQGLVVTGASLAIIGFYQVRSRFQSSTPTYLYSILVLIVGSFAAAGALQHGPLSEIIYKRSVSLRGQYWKAAIEMGKSHPFTGVGMDGYGDWYRRARTEYAATTLPGPGTVTNAAHNVALDVFAYGGIPLFFCYLAMIIVGIRAIIKVTIREKAYDGTFVALTTTWVAYQLQSLISINQVGLAIWGWVLLGTLVAYEYSTRTVGENTQKQKKLQKAELIFSPQLVGGIGAIVGALIAVPPLSADMRWVAALNSQNGSVVIDSLKPTYLSPSDSTRLAQAVMTFENSKLFDQAHEIAIQGVSYNPDSFDAWRVLYAISKATSSEKELALKNMKRLDPHNPDVLAQ